MNLRYFLVEFDGHTYPADVTEFDDMQAALNELSIREPLEPVGGETVLLFAESEEILRITHPGYFEDPFAALRHTVREMADAARERLDRKPVGTR
jgi:hypothetical protein